MHLKILNFYGGLFRLLLYLLVGPCLVFYPVCLFSRNVDVQLSQQRFGG